MTLRSILLSTLVLAALFPAASRAQDFPDTWGRGWRRYPPKFPSPTRRDRRFTFTRLLYRSAWREWGGRGWSTDYPEGDINFMRRFAELTTAAVSTDSAGGFDHVVVTLTDNRVFSYPLTYTSDMGTLEFSELEAARLRTYLLKGGFLWVDDFWGDRGWSQWAQEIGKALPPREYPIFDIPLDHPLFHSLYDVKALPQIPSIQFWRRSGGGTSERGPESATPHLRGIQDQQGRLIVLISHNTDIADGWEREGEEYEYFYRFSPVAYALAVNVVLYVMTH